MNNNLLQLEGRIVVVAGAGGGGLGTAVTALACIDAPAVGWWALAAWTAVVCMLFATIDYHWRKKTNIPARPARWPST